MNGYPTREALRKLARDTRNQYGINDAHVLQRDFVRIFKALNIRLDSWKHFRKVNGAYFSDDQGHTIVVKRGLPPGPRLFTLAHELKHHLVDREQGIPSLCAPKFRDREVERGADVFAAEFMFPSAYLVEELQRFGARRTMSPEDIVQFKAWTRSTMSYASLCIQLERVGYVVPESIGKVRWSDIEIAIGLRRRRSK